MAASSEAELRDPFLGEIDPSVAENDVDDEVRDPNFIVSDADGTDSDSELDTTEAKVKKTGLLQQALPQLFRHREVHGKFFSLNVFECCNLTPSDLEFLATGHLRLHSLIVGRCPELEDDPAGVTTQLCLMTELKVLKIEQMTWLSPVQVQKILDSCNLKTFHFTPRWVKSTRSWVKLYDKHKSVLTGNDFGAMYLKCSQGLTTQHYLDMCDRKPFFHWSGIDYSSQDILDIFGDSE
ncbi:hypothetical protein BaRGS_00040014 [Batillaria attramentaria]|uniref:Uncharacterized protein n=1 Tax=Batillaria attramentaria TaxID=370345 RepID=A0ABD0J1C6_9CAEN